MFSFETTMRRLFYIIVVLPKVIHSAYIQQLPDTPWIYSDYHQGLWNTNNNYNLMQLLSPIPSNYHSLQYGGKKYTQTGYLPTDVIGTLNSLQIFNNKLQYEFPSLKFRELSKVERRTVNENVPQQLPAKAELTRPNGFTRDVVTPGSGSLGITKLSNGQFTLGSGSLGYGASPTGARS